MEALLISVVIPVKNGDAWLDTTIPSILNQTLAASTEIIIVDSGSTDNTLAILSKYPVKVINIPPGEFNHGTTRNIGVAAAKGKYVVLTVQDASPANEYWLQELLNGFDDGNVAGVCGQQTVPHDTDKNPVDWFRPISAPGKKKYTFKNVAEFDRLTADEKKAVCSWDDVTAMYRRDILLSLPFQKVSFAEDALWARDALRKGYSIVYNTAARVYHYHFETPEYTFRRCFTVYYNFYKYFGTVPGLVPNGLIPLLKNTKLLLKENSISWAGKLNWLIFNYRQRKAANRAAAVFLSALKTGESLLDSKHFEICQSPPAALKPGF